MVGVVRHAWLIGPVERTRRWLLGRTDGADEQAVGEDSVSRLWRSGVVVVDCRPAERGSAGQATACSALVRHVVPWLLENDPAAVRRRNATAYLLAPDLFALAGDSLPTSSSLDRELNRGELRRLGVGLSELLFAWGANGAVTVAFEHVEIADAVDQVLITEALRAVPAELVRLVACTTTGAVPENLRPALAETAVRHDLTASSDKRGSGQPWL